MSEQPSTVCCATSDAEVVDEKPSSTNLATALATAEPKRALVVPPEPVTDRERQLKFLAWHAAQSGMFKRFGNASAALMVMKFGDDLGLTPTCSLTSIHFFEGKPTMSGNLMWSLVMGNQEWEDSSIDQHDAKGCVITWRKNGKPRGQSSHTDEDSKREQVFGKLNYAKYPEAMHFNRAVSKGFKMFTPHLANGYTVYTPDELGMRIDSSGEAVVEDVQVSVINNNEPCPSLDRVRRALDSLGWSAQQAASTLGVSPEKVINPTEEDARRIAQLLEVRLSAQQVNK